jgi:hypothetical protein
VKGGKKPKGNSNNKAKKTSNTGVGQEDPPEFEDWTDNKKHIVRKCTFDIDKSVKLDRKERDRVQFLIRKYIVEDPLDFEQYNYELAMLLDRAFAAAFDVNILHNFTAARKVNFGLFSLQTFARFASWWESTGARSRSSGSSERSATSSSSDSPSSGSSERPASPVQEAPSRNYFMWRAKNLVASFFQGRIR